MSTSNPLLTTKFQEALVLAAEWHAAQTRKGSGVPYLSHLLGVASLALEFGANETEAVAALLHDALEDGPHNTGRSHQDLRAEIVRRFGKEAARLVDAATDATPDPHGPKPDWATRKRAYLGHLSQASVSALLVSASDKLHNSRSISVNAFTDGEGVFERFTAGKNGTVQYYRLLADAYHMAAQRPEVAARPRLLALFAELERTVSALETALGLGKEAVRVFAPLG
ncbi:bifunctional (p)ppGpp synthetase/guanosine-3',5'-bis(diphosphate) 3'-pyrophosphohydrolase [Deinococcus detaillensis]|uniref:Bifunctional (P)ppGpp synthetase/guanosine-3',5'-bis(Diphosphate) 3'-pyrophosphohydrolase n=1 Tax=Deinococcus detaillensis TaxID=2592048 RepID=A0A553UWC3_9DEIO|nr:HD domain-containing protein [Deinococcus detaillensis]TSA84502.1 bifunctional (p)ppGpp synthetase/guanosine-3',5'-bis(diphosphate) 3'-pyrophosphohydrolase [Deinococcus detaillensis]